MRSMHFRHDVSSASGLIFAAFGGGAVRPSEYAGHTPLIHMVADRSGLLRLHGCHGSLEFLQTHGFKADD